MSNDYSRTINFTSSSADYELLTDVNIKNAIKTRLKITTDSEYNNTIANGIANMGFCVFVNDRVSINGEPYVYNSPIYNTVVGDGIIGTALIKSIKVESKDTVGDFYFRIS